MKHATQKTPNVSCSQGIDAIHIGQTISYLYSVELATYRINCV